MTQLGSFQAPFSEDRASLNLGGLPVPCLVVGNKLDQLAKYRSRYSQSWSQLVRHSDRVGPVAMPLPWGFEEHGRMPFAFSWQQPAAIGQQLLVGCIRKGG